MYRWSIAFVVGWGVLAVGGAAAEDQLMPMTPELARELNLSLEEAPEFIVVRPPLTLSPNEQARAAAGLETATQPSQGSAKAILLVDDFEDANIDGWIDLSGTCPVSAYAEAPGALASSFGMRIDGGCDDHFEGRMFDIGGFAPTSVSFSIQPGNASLYDSYVVLGDDNVAFDNGIVFFYARSSGVWSAFSDGQTYIFGNYVAGQWYDVTFIIDWDCAVIDVWIDGTLRQSDVPFRTPTVTEITRMHFYNYNNSTAKIDEITMSTPPASFLIFSDDWERGRNCHWDNVVE